MRPVRAMAGWFGVAACDVVAYALAALSFAADWQMPAWRTMIPFTDPLLSGLVAFRVVVGRR
ncbi:hypothetical protein [Gordonia sp. KTR9]|uniref:hypothetical protein n=1 Tax=Gordonia sp. KTR9 TaxID=337191 RepID=UPI0003A41C58|nr:hypothetical protein [Gordonia sp. KTR9]